MELYLFFLYNHLELYVKGKTDLFKCMIIACLKLQASFLAVALF
jgi:hypothetical protein